MIFTKECIMQAKHDFYKVFGCKADRLVIGPVEFTELKSWVHDSRLINFTNYTVYGLSVRLVSYLDRWYLERDVQDTPIKEKSSGT